MRESRSLAIIACSVIFMILLLGANLIMEYNKTVREIPRGEVYNKPVVKVYVTGQVQNPGVYELENDKRIVDAIEMAGGATENGNIEELDLAEFLTDGQTIRVNPKPDETAQTVQTSAETPKISVGGKININTADVAELSKLSGIGEALSKRIITYRESNGNFKTIEDIQKVSGISEKRFEAIRNDITV